MIKIIFLTTAISIYLIVIYIKKRRSVNDFYQVPNDVRKNYKKISIPYEKIQLQSRGYFESEIDKAYPIKINMLDSLFNKKEENKIYKEVSILSYNDFLIKGKPVLLKSKSIYLPEILLSQKLKEKKVIDIYFDESNINAVYYDLSFLITPQAYF